MTLLEIEVATADDGRPLLRLHVLLADGVKTYEGPTSVPEAMALAAELCRACGYPVDAD